MNNISNPILAEDKIAKAIYDAGLGKHQGTFIVKTGFNWVEVNEVRQSDELKSSGGYGSCQKNTLL